MRPFENSSCLDEMLTSWLFHSPSAQADISKSRYHTGMNKLHLKSYHPTVIVDLNEDEFGRRSQFGDMARKIQ